MATKVKVTTTPYDATVAKANAILNGLSTKNQRATASQQAKAQLSPQLAAQNAANAAQQTYLQNLYNSQTGYSLAMAKLADPNGQAALGDYTAAASTLGALGQGITGQAGQDFQNAANQAAQTAASLTGGQGSVQGAYDPSGLASSGYATGYALPGASLADQAVTAAADARNRQLAAANNLGVQAAQTQANQAQAESQGQQALAAIRAQQPSIFQSALSAEQQEHDQAFNTLASLTGDRASFLQNRSQAAEQAKQFGITTKQNASQFKTTSAETHLTDLANIAYNKGQLKLAAGYFKQAGDLQAGKITAQGLANQSAKLQNTAATEAMTGYQANGKLAPGFTLVNGTPMKTSDYISGIRAQNAAATANTSAANALNTTAKSALKIVSAAANNGYQKPGTHWITVYKTDPKTGKAVSTGRQRPVTYGGSSASPLPYDQVLNQVLALGPQTPQWAARARQIVNSNAAYAQGQNGRPYEGKLAVQAANTFVKEGIAAHQTYQSILNHGIGLQIIPEAALRQALIARFGPVTTGFAPGSQVPTAPATNAFGTPTTASLFG